MRTGMGKIDKLESRIEENDKNKISRIGHDNPINQQLFKIGLLNDMTLPYLTYLTYLAYPVIFVYLPSCYLF